MKDFVDGLRKPYKNLHFAGTETASQWMGYMDGAVDAGRRAASEVLVALRDNDQEKDNDIDIYTFESQSKEFIEEKKLLDRSFLCRSSISKLSSTTLEILLCNSNNYRDSRCFFQNSLSDNISVILSLYFLYP